MEEQKPTMTDFPKLRCPFIRQTFEVNEAQWKKAGSKLKLRKAEVYLVVDQVNPGYEWVFEDPNTIAVEKLDGTNVKVKTENGRLVAVQNRLNLIDPLQVMKGKTFIIEGVFQAINKGYLSENGEAAGEVIGPKVQGNPYQLDVHLWFPFERAVSNLSYKSFYDHERNFENWSSWFESWLHSRFFTKRASKLKLDEKVFAEGVVFYNLKRRDEGKTWMAKLRRDMFPWYYEKQLEIMGYCTEGRTKEEDQDKFD